MKKYKMMVNVRGFIFDVEAENLEEAENKAKLLFEAKTNGSVMLDVSYVEELEE